MRRDAIAAIGVFFYFMTGLSLFVETVYHGGGINFRILIMWVISAASFAFFLLRPRGEP